MSGEEITMTLTAEEAHGVLRAREHARHDWRIVSTPTAYQARCACGWTSPKRPLSNDGMTRATHDGTLHVPDALRAWEASA